ncbi:MAG: signal peptide peptidase SppA [Myxococcota bacterium]
MATLSRIFILLSCLLVVMGAPAYAAPSDSAPQGVRLPWTFAPEQSGVESVLNHAAGLGFLEGAGLGLGFSTSVLGGEPLDGITTLGAVRLGPIGLGGGYSYVGEVGAFDRGTHRMDLAVAWRALSSVSLGLRYMELYGPTPEPFTDVDAGEPEEAAALDYSSVALSMTYRPVRALSLSFGAERLNSPDYGASSLAPMLSLGVGLRPGTERVTFGIEGQVSVEDEPTWLAGGTLRIMPVPGVVVAGYGRYGQSPGQADMMTWGGYVAFQQGLLSAAVTVDRRDPATSGGERSMSIGGLVTVTTETKPSLYEPGGRVVKIPISGPIAERRNVELLSPDTLPFGYWLVLLDMMAHDDTVEGVLLDIRSAPLWGQTWELREAIKRLKAAGKSVTARMVWGDMRSMYLASVAERIYLHPAGGLMLTGLAVTHTYLKGLLDKLGVQAQFVKWSEYKSASEPLTQTGPSEPATEQTREMLNIFDRHWREAVGQGRKVDPKALDAVLASGPQTMTMAHTQRMIDRVVHDDALNDALSDDLGRRVTIIEGYRPSPRAWRRWRSPRRVAIVPVVGTIVDGRSQPFKLPIFGATTGEEDFKEAIERAVNDRDVVGIVVRVSSPGGSVVASERMHRVLVKARERKPVVVSFGDFAASGGYYLACGAQRILSTPLSITGSIGIFTGKVDLSQLYDRVGVTTRTEKTTPRADAQGSHRPWTEEEQAVAKDRLKAYYDLFVGHVAEARKMKVETAEARARGRVYLGERAMALNLVDSEGSLWDAVAAVRELAGIDPREALDLGYGPQPGLMQKIAVLLGGALGLSSDVSLSIPKALEPIQRMLAALASLQDGHVQARLPYDIEVQ